MRSIFLIFVLTALVFNTLAQKWSAEIERITGNPKLKTIHIKPGLYTVVGTRTIDTDSLQETYYFDGYFKLGNHDSIVINLKQFRKNEVYSNGVKRSLTVPTGKELALFALDSNHVKIPINQIHYLDYMNEKWKDATEYGEIIIWGSLLALVVSPFICYNYSEKEMKKEMYTKWALGSTIGLASGVLCTITLGSFAGHKRFLFKSGWNDQKNTVWKFR